MTGLRHELKMSHFGSLSSKLLLHVLWGQTMHVGADRVIRTLPLERSAEGLTAKVLSERLVKLDRFGILEKKKFPEIPRRAEYHLTPLGRRRLSKVD